MTRIDRYLWVAVLQGLLIAWFALVTLVVFFDFIGEADNLDENYSGLQALIYLLFSVPSRLYELFPTAMLLGTLLGLGNLAANSEFTAMRAAGISITQIIFSVLKIGVILVLAVFLMGEYLVPQTDLAGRNFKSSLSNKNIVMVRGASLWVKDKNRMFHIGQVWSESRLTDVTIYSILPDYKGLESKTHVETIESGENGWTLQGITEHSFEPDRVKITKSASRIEQSLLNKKYINIASVKPDQLSIAELTDLIAYQRNNELNAGKFELAYWKRFSAPLSALVMLILAMPFLFGSQRGGGAGQRVFIGIIVGVVFFLINRVLNELGVVYGLPPLVSAFLPAAVFFIAAIIGLRRFATA